MDQTAHYDSKHARTLEALRRTICMAEPGGELVLHETALTAEFGMSRTPIRQILQRLAYERLVETRSGVGTAAVPLRAEQRDRHGLVHRGILQAILPLDLPDLSVARHMDVLALRGLAAMIGDGDRDLHYDALSRLHAILSDLIPDPVLADAFSASHWRMTRWHMQAVALDPAAAGRAFRGFVGHVTAYAPRNATDLLRRVIDGEADRT